MSRLDLVPRSPSAPSLVVTTPRPPYRAPEYPVRPMARPFALAGGGGVGTDATAYADAVTMPPAPAAPAGGAAAPVTATGCGCRT